MMQGEKKNGFFRKYANVLVFLAAFVFLVIIYGNASGDTIGLKVEENSLIITGPSSFREEIEFDDIESVELTERPEEPGVSAGGSESSHCVCGLFENDKYGKYTAAYLKKPVTCIAIYRSEGVCLVNFESDDATKSFYDAFCKLLYGTGEEQAEGE